MQYWYMSHSRIKKYLPIVGNCAFNEPLVIAAVTFAMCVFYTHALNGKALIGNHSVMGGILRCPHCFRRSYYNVLSFDQASNQKALFVSFILLATTLTSVIYFMNVMIGIWVLFHKWVTFISKINNFFILKYKYVFIYTFLQFLDPPPIL